MLSTCTFHRSGLVCIDSTDCGLGIPWDGRLVMLDVSLDPLEYVCLPWWMKYWLRLEEIAKVMDVSLGWLPNTEKSKLFPWNVSPGLDRLWTVYRHAGVIVCHSSNAIARMIVS